VTMAGADAHAPSGLGFFRGPLIEALVAAFALAALAAWSSRAFARGRLGA